MCVFVENTAMASWIKIWFVHLCVHVGKVYWINVSIVGRSKEDKKLALFTYMCVCVCVYVYVRDRKYGPFVFSTFDDPFFWQH